MSLKAISTTMVRYLHAIHIKKNLLTIFFVIRFPEQWLSHRNHLTYPNIKQFHYLLDEQKNQYDVSTFHIGIPTVKFVDVSPFTSNK